MNLSDKLKAELNPEQFAVATHVAGPASIMAGAGSGKTHTLMSRLSFLVDMGVPANRILLLTFTNAVADEMIERSCKQLNSKCADAHACTYHKFCNQMLRRYGSRVNMKDYSILSYTETKNMIDYVKNANPFYDNLRGFPSCGIVADIISMSINKMTTIKEVVTKIDKYSKYRDYEQEIQMLANEVRKYSFDAQKFTYDDLLVYMDELLSYDDVCKKIASMFDYIMVDEFQDTNNLQESIIVRLSQYNDNIVVVGDISQSIYAFRGANVKNLQNFDKKLNHCKIIPLTYNYRSTQEVLNLSNSVMKNNVKSWKYYDMISPNKQGDLPSLFLTHDQVSEVDDTMSLIQYYHDVLNIPYSEIAILIRGSMQSFGIENKLQQKKIEFIKMGGLKFMDLDAVGDMIALFSIVVNPHDLLSWYRVLQLHPLIGKKYAKEISDECLRSDFLINNCHSGKKLYSELLNLNRHYQEWKSHTSLEHLFEMLSDYYFDTRIRACDLSRMKDELKEEERTKIEHDREVVDALHNMSYKYNDAVSFVDDIVLDATEKVTPSENTLTISTVHSAKGLEWTAVIILDAVEGKFPNVRKDFWYMEEDEEELRCFYVAMTRAKKYLTIIAPEYITAYGGYSEKTELSHYLIGSEKYYKHMSRKDILGI